MQMQAPSQQMQALGQQALSRQAPSHPPLQMQALSWRALGRRWRALGTLMRPPQESPMGEDPDCPKRLKMHPCRPIPSTRGNPSHPPLQMQALSQQMQALSQQAPSEQAPTHPPPQMQADRKVEPEPPEPPPAGSEPPPAGSDPKSLEQFHPGHELKLTNCHQHTL